MRLSMWILYDYLKDYSPVPMIVSGQMVLRNVRILSDTISKADSTVYLMNAENYISGEKDKIICVHHQDMLLLQSDEMEEVFNKILDCFDFYNQWSDDCMDAIHRGCSLQELCDRSSGLFHDHVFIADSSHILLHSISPIPYDRTSLSEKQKEGMELLRDTWTARSLPLNEITEIRKMQMIYRPTSAVYAGSTSWDDITILLVNLFQNDSLWGWLVEPCILSCVSSPGQSFADPDKNCSERQTSQRSRQSSADSDENSRKPSISSPGEQHLLEAFGSLVEQWLQTEASLQDQMQNFSLLFQNAFQPKQQDPSHLLALQNHLNNIGWIPLARKSLYVIKNTDEDLQILKNLGYRYSRKPGCLTGMMDNTLLLLTNNELADMKRLASELPFDLKNADCYACRSYPFTNLAQCSEQKALSDLAIQYSSGQPGTLHDCSAYILQYLKEIVKKHSQVNLVHPIIRQLENYDRKNQSELSETLFVFLQNERNYQLTASQLHVHRNTVQYRIEKIIELTGLDLASLDTRLYLLTSFYLNK